jgi:hypothetical protein
MKRFAFLFNCLVLVFTLVPLTGCSALTAAPAPLPTYTGSRFEIGYDDALSSFTLVAMGTLKLDGTANAITPQQAKQLLPLWQALRSSVNIGGAGQAEVDALLAQIDQAMTAEQVTAVNAMKLTRDEMRAWGQEKGLVPSGFSPQMMATQQAAARSGGMPGAVAVGLLDAIIEYLEQSQ